MTFWQFTWRLATGSHLDGVARTDATWLRRGTKPDHRLTWWTSKSRLSRMAWRWAFIIVPVLAYQGYVHAPVIQVNLVIVLVGVYAPFLSWRVAIMVIARVPRVRVVTVVMPVDQEPIEVNPDIDEVVDAIPVQELESPDITQMECIPDLDEINDAIKRRRNRMD